MTRIQQWLKLAGECVILPLFGVIVVGVCWPWIAVKRRGREAGYMPKIIWGPTPIINIATNAAADRLYGFQSDTLVYRPYYITNEFTYNLERWWRYKFLALLIPWGAFVWAVLRYDIFQLYFDGGFLNRTIGKWLEFPLLRLLGKKVVVSAYGADVRTESKTRALGAYNCCLDCTQRLVACICDDVKAQKNLAHVHRYANVTLSMGDMVEYTPGSRNDMFYWAIDLKKWPYVGVSLASRPVRIVHAPNHPQFKGSRFLFECVGELKAEGYPVELDVVTGMSNDEAMEIYKGADIVADQFLIGWHGNFAVEGMALGKPVVAFIRKPELYFPKGVRCPIVSANPDSLKQILVSLIENPEWRQELGVQGRQYVEQVFSLERVGERMTRLYGQLGFERPMMEGVQ
jgi:glycosyltransferase involved in cell wall biosynthesis